MKKLIIFGTGGNCIDILDTINEINENSRETIYECIGFLDDNKKKWGETHYGIGVLGPLNSASNYDGCLFVNGIGSSSNFWKKKGIILKAKIEIDRFETIIHPSANVSKMSKLGRGTVILQNVTIASNVSIGNHVIILPNTVISHDCFIGNYTCISGGACISGRVKIGNSCYIGTNSSIIDNSAIGDCSLVGMGSVVIDSVEENSIVVGNPAELLRNTFKR